MAYGDYYRQFITKWCESVYKLETFPDDIVIVTDDIEDANKKIPENIKNFIKVIHSKSTSMRHPQFLVNDAISVTETEWVCKMDIDDIILPHAFNKLSATESDVYMFGAQPSWQENPWPARDVSTLDVYKSNTNLVLSGSPFRRWIWEKSPFKNITYGDWVFWFEAAKNKAKFFPSSTIDYIYVAHGGNITSNINVEKEESVARNLIKNIWAE